MKLKELEQCLEQLEEFDKPKWKWEQYVTQPHIASRILHSIDVRFNDLKDKVVADLGCGCGSLSIGSCLLDAAYVVGFDIDCEALTILQSNAAQLSINNIDVVLASVPQNVPDCLKGYFDTVIMNPPFGTKTKGVDITFLKVALQMTKGSVYSLHKTSTREHILKKAKQFGAQCQVLAELRFDLPKSYNFHKKNSVDVEVDFIRFVLPQSIQ